MSGTSNSGVACVAPRLRRRPLARDRRGAILLFVAVSMVVLIGFLAMTIDVGAGGRQRRIAQTAADAGALGGGTEIYRLQSAASVRASALNEAVRNGFVADDVTVNYPPATGPYAGNNQYVEVLINKNIPTIFGSIFNIASLNIAARGVAGVGSYSLNCVYSLNPTTGSALQVDNGGLLHTNCGIAVNSNVDLNSSGQIIGGGSGIAIYGDWTGNSNKISPDPSIGTAQVSDPLSGLQMPSVPPTLCAGKTGPLTISKDTILNPGFYCGGINITNKKTLLTPGTYITVGGGFTVGTSGTVVGDGVTLVNTVDSTGTNAFGVFNFGTGCKATLSAPTSGSLTGILMFEDPNDPLTVGNTNVNTFACSSDDPIELTGTLYFPNETILFNGSNSDTNIDGAIVAYNVEVSAKLHITMDTSGNTALHRLSLVQ